MIKPVLGLKVYDVIVGLGVIVHDFYHNIVYTLTPLHTIIIIGGIRPLMP